MPDSTVWTISVLIAALGSICLYHKRSLRYLQLFQQEEYTAGRFINWYFQHKVFDRRASASVIVILLTSLFVAKLPLLSVIVSLLGACRLLFIAYSEDNPLTTGKIKLKMTARAKRVFNLAWVFYLAALLICTFICIQYGNGYATTIFWLAQLAFIQSHAFWLLLSNMLLAPYEKNLQENFARQARALIKQHNPVVIGITGSYGKTSTKVVLKDILGAVAPTFSTPGSINSYMGVTREIRERLRPDHKFAVIEMGAYYRGSIAKMCSLTPPKAGIITSIGVMHLERFGGQEAIYLAKSELAQAIPEDGILVCNGDYEYCRKIAAENPKRVTLLYGLEPERGQLDALMYDLHSSESGSHFKIRWQGSEYDGFAAVLGRPMLSNILGAFTLVCALRVPPQVAIAALRNVKPESNRLEPVKTYISTLAAGNGSDNGDRPGKILRLNDAYNSNPIGFAAALDVLADMPGGKKILVTPGMIELGDMQMEENRKIALKAASICDLVVVVGATNKEALREGLTEGGLNPDCVKEFASMQSAFSHLSDCCQDGDIVLIENDLPDLYENVPSF